MRRAISAAEGGSLSKLIVVSVTYGEYTAAHAPASATTPSRTH
ncbi:MAG TPA: hypothetical protein VGM60_17235 [Pseudonocardia sp.]|jgi:hypothetical protein